MRIAFQRAPLNACIELWKRFYPERYWVSEELLRVNSIDAPTFDWGCSFVEMRGSDVVGLSILKRSSGMLYPGPDPDVAHLSAIAFNEPQIGVDLVAASKKVLRDRGIYKLMFGQDSHHFFPGCPVDHPALRDFLMIEGFSEADECFDLERDLSDYVPPANCLGPLQAHPGNGVASDDLGEQGPAVRPLRKEDLGMLDSFLNREFPGRWRHDTMSKTEIEESPDFVYGLFDAGRLEGFALTQREGCRKPIGGAIWNQDLGANWGSLGPIGVSKSVRKRGLGDALLGSALLGLKQSGARRTIIDWTTLGQFYGRHGFEISRRYRPLSMRLDA